MGPRWLLCVCSCIALGPSLTLAQSYPPLGIVGESAPNGVFDPSVEYAPKGNEGWLAYSAVYGSASPWGPNVETRLARTEDGGQTFSFASVVNPSTPAQVDVAGRGLTDGFWNYEVPALVHDPEDAGREWKLFAHRIFRPFDPSDPTLEEHLPAYGWITLRTAVDPSGSWSPEVALFGSSFFPPPPFSTQQNVNALDPSLASQLVYSEPGALVQGGVLYVTLTGLLQTGPDRIVLLASDDHGTSWRYVGAPLTNPVAATLGYLSFDGSALVEQLGRTFLLASPRSAAFLHDGTLVFEFEDLARSLLLASGGVPMVVTHVPIDPALAPPTNVGGGQADYHERDANGILMNQLHLANAPALFRVFRTQRAPISGTSVPALGVGPGAALGLLVLGALLLARG